MGAGEPLSSVTGTKSSSVSPPAPATCTGPDDMGTGTTMAADGAWLAVSGEEVDMVLAKEDMNWLALVVVEADKGASKEDGA